MIAVRCSLGDLPAVVDALAGRDVEIVVVGAEIADEIDTDNSEPVVPETGSTTSTTCTRCHGPTDSTHRRCTTCRVRERDRQRTRRVRSDDSTRTHGDTLRTDGAYDLRTPSLTTGTSTSPSSVQVQVPNVVVDDGGGEYAGDDGRTQPLSPFARARQIRQIGADRAAARAAAGGAQ